MMGSGEPTCVPTKFVVFSDDWGVHPSSCQHLFKRIAQRHEVHWINTVGMRLPRFTIADFRKIVDKLRRMARRSDEQSQVDAGENSVNVIQPPMLPFTWAWSRAFNSWSVARVLRSIDFSGQPPIVVTTLPNTCDYIDAVPTKKIVYYCVDDFSEWPGLDKQTILSMEKRLLNKADLFIATSDALYSRLKETGKPTTLLSHGVDIRLFASETKSLCSLLEKIPEPRVGYFGLFDGRSDEALLEEVAALLPKIAFVIAGRTEISAPRLRRMPNVHFVGPIEYERLPNLISGLSVLMLPYRVNALSDSLSPLKLKEYLVTGRPVISTPIAAVRTLTDLVSVVETPGEWVEAIVASLKVPGERRKQLMLSRFRRESWEVKAADFVSLCIREH